MSSWIEVSRCGQAFGEVMADENRHQHEIGVKVPDLVLQDLAILAESRPGHAKIVDFDLRAALLEKGQVIVGERDNGSDGKGVSECRNAPNPRTFVFLELRPGIPQA